MKALVQNLDAWEAWFKTTPHLGTEGDVGEEEDPLVICNRVFLVF